MKQLLSLPIVILTLFACSDDDNSTTGLIEGTYIGTFYRSSPNARWVTADVQITFEEGRFSGSSSITRYPAICEGTYQRSTSSTIQFSNECPFTADFDWTFILDGEFQLRQEGTKQILSRSYEGLVSDTYELGLK